MWIFFGKLSGRRFDQLLNRDFIEMRFNNKQKGATLVEVTLTFPAFILTTLFAIDICRYAFGYVMINYAAYNAVSTAAISDIELATSPKASSISMGCNTQDSSVCNRYNEVLSTITDAGESFTSFVDGAVIDLQRFQLNSQGAYGGATDIDAVAVGMEVKSSPVAFLRPGEAALREGNKSVNCGATDSAAVFTHPTRKPTFQCTNGAGVPAWPALGRTEWSGAPPEGTILDKGIETWDNVLMNEPLVVRIEGKFKPILSFLGTWDVSATQTAFRKTRLEGNYKGVTPEDPKVLNYELNEVVAAWPDPGPIPTEVPLPDPTDPSFCNVINKFPSMCDEVNCFTNRWRCDNCAKPCFGGG